MSAIPRSLPNQIWALIIPYWFKEDRWFARLLLLILVLAELASVKAMLYFNNWNGSFFNALQARQYDQYLSLLKTFFIVVTVIVAISVLKTYLQQWLTIRWRSWMTRHLLKGWLDGNRFYHIETLQSMDNSDQRISEDTLLLAQYTLELGLGLLSNVVSFITFASVVWNLSGPLHLVVMNHSVTVPGYMLWVAIFYALLGSVLTHGLGKPLARITMDKQRLEADFRFMMAQVRENAEQIAIYHGTKIEKTRLFTCYQKIVGNWHHYMTYTKRLSIVTTGYFQLAAFFPLLVLAPRYFNSSINLGDMTQASSAFSMAVGALSWFMNSYDHFYSWLGVARRLCAMRQTLNNPVNKGNTINYSAAPDGQLQLHHLFIQLPDGAPLLLIESLKLSRGDRLIIRGPSGSGKSTLLRALAGVWLYGKGEIQLPVSEKVLFLSQRSYLPSGSLKSALCYPMGSNQLSDTRCREVLTLCNLVSYVDKLNNEDHWQRRLSPGEQQRLSMARAILSEPAFLFLDEATSALDKDNEQQLYHLLLQKLPDTCIVSIAHRESLYDFHHRTLDIMPMDGKAPVPHYGSAGSIEKSSALNSQEKLCESI